MSEQREARAQTRRRDVFRAMTAGVAIAVVGRAVEVEALPPNAADKRKSRYQANSPEVQDFYRVNRYPPR
jgi:hypothetical protein